MMIASKSGFVSCKSLPYDAEVEYLESTGTQWIDTGIPFDHTMDIYCAFTPISDPLGWTVGCGIFGARQTANSRNITGVWTYDPNYAAIAGGAFITECDFNNSNYTTYRAFVNDRVILNSYIELRNSKNIREVRINGTVMASSMATCPDVFSTAGNGYLFWTNGPSGAFAKGSIKVYHFRITNDSGILLNFVPVRIGTEGAMYDKVTKQLFHNQGIDNFVIGPDKT